MKCPLGHENESSAIFCKYCDAYLAYSTATTGDTANGGRSAEAGDTETDIAVGSGLAVTTETPEQSPTPERENPEYHWYREPEEPITEQAGKPEEKVRCANSACSASTNPPEPARFRFCRVCGWALEPIAGEKARWALPRRVRDYVRRRLTRVAPAQDPAGPNRLHSRPIVLAVLLLAVAAALVGVYGVWGPSTGVVRWYKDGVIGGYRSSREAVFPRFSPVLPARIFYSTPQCFVGLKARPATDNPQTRQANGASPSKFTATGLLRGAKVSRPCYPIRSEHSVADAFDQDIATYWLSPTPRATNDRLAAWFNPPATIDVVTIFAGDPEGTQVVPKNIQMTFYGPAEKRYYPNPSYYPPKKPSGPTSSSIARPYWPVKAVMEWTLEDTQSQQRFSTGHLTGIARVVITIRGFYANANPRATQALTNVEFFDKH